MTSHNETALLDAYGEVTEQIKQLEKKKAELRKELGQFFENLSGTGVINGREYSIKYSMSAGRKTLDKAALVEDTGIDLSAYEKVGKPFITLTASKIV